MSKPSFYKWKNTDTAQCLPTVFVRWRPKGFGVGWLIWAFEVRFYRLPVAPEPLAAPKTKETK